MVKLSTLKSIYWCIMRFDYDGAVYLAKSANCNDLLAGYYTDGDQDPNTCEYWKIYYKEDCLLDAAYSSGLAGWFRNEGRWA